MKVLLELMFLGGEAGGSLALPRELPFVPDPKFGLWELPGLVDRGLGFFPQMIQWIDSAGYFSVVGTVGGDIEPPDDDCTQFEDIEGKFADQLRKAGWVDIEPGYRPFSEAAVKPTESGSAPPSLVDINVVTERANRWMVPELRTPMLGCRAVHLMDRAGVKTLRELSRKTPRELVQQKNVGKVLLYTLEIWLKRYGLAFPISVEESGLWRRT
jgi:hypothetical protein